MFSILEPYWKIGSSFHFDGCTLCIVESKRRPGEWRLAHRLRGDTRWRLSPIVSETGSRDLFQRSYREDSCRSNPRLTTYLHRRQVYIRQAMPERFKKHRAALRHRLELKSIEALPGFGIF